MKKVVLTGATSMLGIALTEYCIQREIEVLAIVRPNSINQGRLPKSDLLSVIECDLDALNMLDIVEVKKGFDVFYHFAWDYTNKEKRDNAKCQELNIKYTLDAVYLAHRLQCELFVGAGSQAEYGIVSEQIAPDTAVNPNIAYGIAKYAAGKLSSILCRDLAMRHIWTRIFSVFGPYDNKDTMIMYAIASLLEEKRPIFTKGEQEWDYLYSKDAAKAFYLIGQSGQNDKVYCIGSGKSKHLYEYISILRNKIDKVLPVGLGDKKYEANQVMRLCADITSLQNDTGFVPDYSFEKGIEETIHWYEEYAGREK